MMKEMQFGCRKTHNFRDSPMFTGATGSIIELQPRCYSCRLLFAASFSEPAKHTEYLCITAESANIT